MQIKIFNIPIGADDGQIEEMNHFLRANKIIDIKKDLALLDGNSCWTFCITYIMANRAFESENAKHSGSSRVDYKEVLDEVTFGKFSDLRKLRKIIADNEAIPAYAVFTDAELAEIAQLQEITIEGIRKIPGIGKKKVEKYADAFTQYNPMMLNETSGPSDGADSKS